MALQEDLKTREIEILRLMAEGLTNREIGERIYIGVETVRWYAKQIYSKFNVSSREEAVARAASLGLLDAAPEQLSEASRTKSKHNLPTQLTSFIGRGKQIAEITDLLSETRLLTLTGPGGTGKTRLALKVAEGLLDTITDGVHFVDLAPVKDSDRVAHAVAQALNIFESGDEAILETLKRAIGQREMLLILDNYEHVIAAASLVSDLMSFSTNIRVIVTSREALRVSGEQIYAVPPMILSENHDSGLSEALALFVHRAQAVKRQFQLDASNTDAVIEICQQLDGIPLAIELAAAQSRFLTPDVILKRMDNRFQSLKSGSRDAPQRQQTLQATIDWSYDLLDESERLLFARLSVFRGGRSLEAIDAVCADDLEIDVLDGLAALVDKSMIRQIEDRLGEPRFVMLETIQEYALQKLEASGETKDMQRRHAHYFAELTSRAHPFLRQAGFEYWYPKLNIEHDNIRSALQWSLFGGDAEPGLRMVDKLGDFWFYEGYHVEGQGWAEQALEHIDDVEPLLQVGALTTASALAWARHDVEHSIELRRQALSIAKEIESVQDIARLTIALAMYTFHFSALTREDYDKAVADIEEGIATLRHIEDKVWVAQGLNALGNIHLNQRHFELARAAYNECLQVCDETGERRREAIVLGPLAAISIDLEDYEEAYRLACQSLQLSHNLQFDYMTNSRLGIFFPTILIKLDFTERAATLLGASSALAERMNMRFQPPMMLSFENINVEVRQQLDEEAFQAAYEVGRKMSLDEAVEFALQELGSD